jgi:hypothetical protein
MITSNCNIQLPDEDDDLFLMSRDEFSPSPSSHELDLGGSNPDSFPAVLHGIVSDESNNDCIHWLPSGTHFTISDKEKVRFRLFGFHARDDVIRLTHKYVVFNAAISFQRRSYPSILEAEEQPSSLASPDV